MAIVKFMGVPVGNLAFIMQTPVEDIADLGGVPAEIGGDYAVTTIGYNASAYVARMEKMNIVVPGSNAYMGSHVTAHYGASAASNGSHARGVFNSGKNSSGNPSQQIEYVNIRSTGDSASFGNSTVTSHHACSAASNGINQRMVSSNGSTGLVGATNIARLEHITISTLGNSVDFGASTQARASAMSVSNGVNERLVTAGGYHSLTVRSVIDTLTINTGSASTSWGDMADKRWGGGSADNGTNDRGVFAAGANATSNIFSGIEYLTMSTLASATNTAFTLAHSLRGCAGVSNKTRESAIFCGGMDGNEGNPQTIINALTINNLANAVTWGNLTQAGGPECEGVNDN